MFIVLLEHLLLFSFFPIYISAQSLAMDHQEPPDLIPILPCDWSAFEDESKRKTVFRNSKTGKELFEPPLAYPLFQHPWYGERIAFYDVATREDFTAKKSSVDFKNGIQITVPDNIIAANKTVTFKVQPAFASREVFVLPDDIEAASPTYLISSSSNILNGKVTLTIEHYVHLETEEQAKSLVFLVANSSPSKGMPYLFKVVDIGDPVFKVGEKVGSISTDHFSWWIIGNRTGSGSANRYTVQVYRSREDSSERFAVIFISCLHTIHLKFLDYLEKELIPQHFKDLSTSEKDISRVKPVYFKRNMFTVDASLSPGWTFVPDITSISKENVDLLTGNPLESQPYPPRIFCQFNPPPDSKDLQTVCTLTLHGVSNSLPSFMNYMRGLTNPLSFKFTLKPPKPQIIESTQRSDVIPNVVEQSNIFQNDPTDASLVHDCTYETMMECSEKIIEGLSNDPQVFATAFFSEGFIPKSILEQILEVPATKREHAIRLFYPILNKIQLYPQRYDNFLAIFEKDETLYGDLLATLKDTHRRRSGEPSL